MLGKSCPVPEEGAEQVRYSLQARNDSICSRSDAEHYLPPLPPRHDAYEVGSIQQRLNRTTVQPPNDALHDLEERPDLVTGLQPTAIKRSDSKSQRNRVPKVVATARYRGQGSKNFRGRSRGRGRFVGTSSETEVKLTGVGRAVGIATEKQVKRSGVGHGRSLGFSTETRVKSPGTADRITMAAGCITMANLRSALRQPPPDVMIRPVLPQYDWSFRPPARPLIVDGQDWDSETKMDVLDEIGIIAVAKSLVDYHGETPVGGQGMTSGSGTSGGGEQQNEQESGNAHDSGPEQTPGPSQTSGGDRNDDESNANDNDGDGDDDEKENENNQDDDSDDEGEFEANDDVDEDEEDVEDGNIDNCISDDVEADISGIRNEIDADSFVFGKSLSLKDTQWRRTKDWTIPPQAGRQKLHGERGTVLTNVCVNRVPVEVMDEDLRYYTVKYNPYINDMKARRAALIAMPGCKWYEKLPLCYDDLIVTKDYLPKETIFRTVHKEIMSTVTITRKDDLHTQQLHMLNHQLHSKMRNLLYTDFGNKSLNGDASVTEFCGEKTMLVLEILDCIMVRGEAGIQLMVDIEHQVKDSSVIQYYIEQLTMKYGEHKALQIANDKLKGKHVLASHTKTGYVIDRIEDTATCSPLSTFPCKFRPVTFVDYILQRYNVQISTNGYMVRMQKFDHDKFAPILPAEICWIIGGKIDIEDDCLDMPKTLLPVEKKDQIVQHIGTFPSEGRLSFVAGHDLIQVEARQLPHPMIKMENCLMTGSSSWENKVTRYLSVPVINSYSVLYLDYITTLKPFVATLNRHMEQHVDYIRHSEVIVRTDGGRDALASYTRELKTLLSTPDKPDLVFCVTPEHSGCFDKMIKHICWVDAPVVCITVPVSDVCKDMMMYGEKLANKALVMMGAVPWSVFSTHTSGGENTGRQEVDVGGQITYSPPLSLLPTLPDGDKIGSVMVVGLYVCEPPDSDEDPVVGVVSSIDSTLTRYTGQACRGHVTNSAIENFPALISNAILRYESETGELPEMAVLYRADVSEGKLGYILVTELQKGWHQAITLVRRQTRNRFYDPKMTGVIVDRDPITRFFMTEGDDVYNPPTGTVVDKVITQPDGMDFYMTSQHTSVTSAVPTYYNVIQDTAGWDADNIQAFTQIQTYQHYTSMEAISVPAVVQYAATLAEKVHEGLVQSPSDSAVLQNRLWWL